MGEVLLALSAKPRQKSQPCDPSARTVTGARANATTAASPTVPVPTAKSLRIEFIRSLLVRPVRRGHQGVLTQAAPEVGSPTASMGPVILTGGAGPPCQPPPPRAVAPRRI